MNTRITRRLAWLLSLLMAAMPFAAAAAEGERTPAEIAQEAFALLLAGDYQALYDRMDPSIQPMLSPEAIGAGWDQLTGTLGEYQNVAQAVEETQGEQITEQFLINLAQGQAVVIFAVNEAGLLSGLVIQPVMQFVQEEALPLPEGAVEEETALRPGADDETRASLVLPEGEGPFPALILVHGSGASDMDESVYGLKPFRDLAMGLAAQGVATLRYDKYPFAHADKYLENPTLAQEYDADVLDALALLAADDRIGPIYIAGHSLGGMLTAHFLQLADGQAAGGVILAGSPRPLWEIQWMQNEDVIAKLSGEQKEQARAIVDAEVEKGKRLLEMTPEELEGELLFGIPAADHYVLAKDNPVEIALELGLPLLILQGGLDWQVSAKDDFSVWEAGLGDADFATMKLYPELSHVFMTVEGGSDGTANDYTKGGHVDQTVIDDIAAWVKAR